MRVPDVEKTTMFRENRFALSLLVNLYPCREHIYIIPMIVPYHYCHLFLDGSLLVSQATRNKHGPVV